MNSLIANLSKQIDMIQTSEDLFQLADKVITKEFPGSYVVCLKIDSESFDFLPIRSVDVPLVKNVEPYLNQGVFAEAVMSKEPLYVFDGSKYEMPAEEGLVVIPVGAGEETYGVMTIVTQKETCRQLFNEKNNPFVIFSSLFSKMVELQIKLESGNNAKPELQETSMNANDILESVVHGVIVFNTENEINIFNKNAEIMFGLSAKDFIGHVYREVFPDRLTRTFDLLMQNTMIDGHILDFELEWELNQDIKIPIGISTSIIYGGQGEQKGVVFICRDMSLMKEVSRLKDLDKMKSEFVSTVSHELKNPIAVIKSSVETLIALKNSGKDFGPEFEKDSLKTINDEIDRLSELINDLLSLSRIESGKVELNRTPVDVKAMMVSIVNLFHVSERTHPVTLNCKTSDEVTLDEKKIKQVVINFINNAIKYSPNGSPITVDVSRTEHKLRVSVTDKGLGIPENALGKVFDKFYRVSGDETASIGGTGLGLAISRKIIELHYGKIWVKSKHGEGSTFGFDLPITHYGEDEVPEQESA